MQLLPDSSEGMGRVGDCTVACVLRVGVEVQVGDVGGDALNVGRVRGHQAADVTTCRASTCVRSSWQMGANPQARRVLCCIVYSLLSRCLAKAYCQWV